MVFELKFSHKKTMRYLIVEDNRQNYQLLEKMLASYGGIEIVEDGHKAIEAFKTAHMEDDPYVGIFLDIMMLKMDGHEVLRTIRDWEQKKNPDGNPVQIVMTTSISDTDTVLKSYDEGCQHYLLKPLKRMI